MASSTYVRRQWNCVSKWIIFTFKFVKRHIHTHRHHHLYTHKQNAYLHHHHHVVPLTRISLTLSRHFSLSFISSGRYSGLHPVSSHSCCMYVRNWSSYICSAIRGGPLEYIIYELVSASPAVSCVSGSSKLDSFRDGMQVAV